MVLTGATRAAADWPLAFVGEAEVAAGERDAPARARPTIATPPATIRRARRRLRRFSLVVISTTPPLDLRCRTHGTDIYRRPRGHSEARTANESRKRPSGRQETDHVASSTRQDLDRPSTRRSPLRRRPVPRRVRPEQPRGRTGSRAGGRNRLPVGGGTFAGVPDGPRWRVGFDLVERQVAPRLQAVLQSEPFAVAVGLAAQARRRVQLEASRSSRRVLHQLNLPAGSDVNRILNELGQLRVQVRQLRDELDRRPEVPPAGPPPKTPSKGAQRGSADRPGRAGGAGPPRR